MSLALDFAIASPSVPTLALYGYNRWHHSERVDRHVESVRHAQLLEAELGIGKADYEVIADIAQKLADYDYEHNPEHFLRPLKSKSVKVPASEVAWRNGVYVRTGRYPSEEEYRKWLGS